MDEMLSLAIYSTAVMEGFLYSLKGMILNETRKTRPLLKKEKISAILPYPLDAFYENGI